MSTVTQAQAPPDAAQRGALVLKEKVLRKIAAQAASELPFIGGRTGGVLGLGSSGDLHARPEVDVELAGTTAYVALTVTMLYPSPLRAGTDALRRHVTEVLERSTAVHVGRLDVTVSSLENAATTKGRTLQ